MRARVVSTLLAASLAAVPATAAADPAITQHVAGMLSDANPHAVAAGLGGEVWFAHTGSSPVVGRINAAGAITTYTNGISGDPKILGIAEGPGGMWFTEAKKKTVARITDAAAITEFDGLADQPQGITGGPDGSVWFTEAGKGAIGRLTSGGALTEVRSGLTSNANALSITRGPDGNLWFTEAAAKRIGRITPQGVITEFNAGLVTGKPQEIAAGPDGNLWFTESGNAAIGRITPQGVITEFTAGLPGGSAPQGITAGPDGHLYFTDPGANAIGRVTTSGAITTFTAGLPASADPQGIAAGSDGALWFAMEAEGAIGRITALPTVGDVRDAAVTSTTATVSAPVTPNSQATTYVFEYGTTTAYGQTTSSSSAGSGAVEQPATAALTGLSPSTTYHVRVVATNATGTTTGADHVLTTTAAGAPSATTEGATSVAPTGATINATVNPQNAATTYRFEWGTDTSYGTDIPLGGAAAGSDGTDHAVSAPLTGLLPNRTYHFRVVATSSGGTTAGEDRTFTTTALAPGAATGGATGITGEAASIAGTTNPRGSTTLYRFEWGTTAAYDRVAPALDLSAGDGHGDQQVSQDLAGLQPNTTYHYRLVAASDAGTTAGADQSFTTAAVAPAASTGDAGGVTETTAALAGLVNGRNSATTARFEWGTTTAYGNATAATAVADDGLDHPLADVLTGLQPGTTYHFRVVAQSAAGTTAGADGTFTTAPAVASQAPADAPAPLPADPIGAPQPPVLPAPAAQLGRSVVAAVTSGTVRYRTPGGGSVVVTGDHAIPTGAVIDATDGRIAITSALDARGRTQTVTVWGGEFRVTQPKVAKGLVELALTRKPSGCAKAKARSARSKPVKLWATDSRGRYRTRGRGSVATVRGTQWLTTETCAGTTTRVTSGAVSVRDLRTGRTVLVKAGHSHLARVKR